MKNKKASRRMIAKKHAKPQVTAGEKKPVSPQKPARERGWRRWASVLVVSALVTVAIVALMSFVVNLNEQNFRVYYESVGYKAGGINVLVLMPQKNFTDASYFYVVPELEDAGFGVEVAAPTTEWVSGERVYVKPQITFDEIDVGRYDALLIVGGDGVRNELWHNKTLIQLVNEFNERNKTIAAICSGVMLVMQSKALIGKNATCSIASPRMFTLVGATGLYENVVVSDNVITGNSDEDSQEFALAVIEKLNSRQSTVKSP